MNVSLTPELASMVRGKVKAGLYQTASEVVREGLRLLEARDEEQMELRKQLRAGFAQLERGRYTEYDARTTPALANEVKARGRRRLARSKAAP